MRTLTTVHLESGHAPTVQRRFADTSHWLEVGDDDPHTHNVLPIHLGADQVVPLIVALAALLDPDEFAELAESLPSAAPEAVSS